MAKKAELLEQAKKLKLDVSSKNTIAEIEAALGESQEEVIKNQKEAGDSPSKPLAKKGKRSVKGLKEAEEKQEKIDRQQHKSTDEPDQPQPVKKPAPKARSRLERRGKNYRDKAKLIDKTKLYSVKEASDLIGKTSSAKFDASVEVHLNLNVDPRQADQNIRGTVSLPHGTGKTSRVAVFATADKHEAAKKAGADIVGEDDFLQLLDKGELNFDVLIAMPQMMAKLGKYARLLGPKGLMPNPKSGTVTADIARAVKEAKGGRVEYRVDKQGLVHAAIGKVSFTPEQIQQNSQTLIDSVEEARPASVKGTYLTKITMTTTMGPSIPISAKV